MAQAPFSRLRHLKSFSEATAPCSVQFTMSVVDQSSQSYMKKPADDFSFSSGISSGDASCDVYKNKVSPTTKGEGSAVYLVWKRGMFTCSNERISHQSKLKRCGPLRPLKMR